MFKKNSSKFQIHTQRAATTSWFQNIGFTSFLVLNALLLVTLRYIQLLINDRLVLDLLIEKDVILYVLFIFISLLAAAVILLRINKLLILGFLSIFITTINLYLTLVYLNVNYELSWLLNVLDSELYGDSILKITRKVWTLDERNRLIGLFCIELGLDMSTLSSSELRLFEFSESPELIKSTVLAILESRKKITLNVSSYYDLMFTKSIFWDRTPFELALFSATTLATIAGIVAFMYFSLYARPSIVPNSNNDLNNNSIVPRGSVVGSAQAPSIVPNSNNNLNNNSFVPRGSVVGSAQAPSIVPNNNNLNNNSFVPRGSVVGSAQAPWIVPDDRGIIIVNLEDIKKEIPGLVYSRPEVQMGDLSIMVPDGYNVFVNHRLLIPISPIPSFPVSPFTLPVFDPAVLCNVEIQLIPSNPCVVIDDGLPLDLGTVNVLPHNMPIVYGFGYENTFSAYITNEITRENLKYLVDIFILHASGNLGIF